MEPDVQVVERVGAGEREKGGGGVDQTQEKKKHRVSQSSPLPPQDHLASVLLGWPPSGPHDAATDAVKSIRLFNLHGALAADPAARARAEAALLESAPEPSFAKRHPSFEGVCMGNRKTCTCGAPFFG